MTTEATGQQASQAVPAAAAPANVAPQTAVPVAAPAAVPAPAPASAAPAAPQGQTDGEGLFGKVGEYAPTGNANLDTALKWAGGLGLNLATSQEMQEAEKGNFGPLRALLASKSIPGIDAYLALAEAAVTEMKAAAAERTAAVQAQVVEAAGSAEAWQEVFNWAADNAEPAEREQINWALEKGGFLAEAVAARLVANYRAQPGVSFDPTSGVVNQLASGDRMPAGNAPLSPAEYGKAVQALRMSLRGAPLENSPEYAALQRRRNAYRG